MSSTGSLTSRVVQLRISKDGIRAELEFAPDYIRDSCLLQEQILELIKQAGLPLTDELRNHTEKIATDAADCAESNPRIVLLALGDPACDAADGEFEWVADFEPQMRTWKGDALIDYYDPKSVLTVPAGVCVGRVLPPQDGKAGCDVFGNEIVPPRIAGSALKVGAGLETRTDGEVWSTVAGRVAFDELTISIVPVIELPHDVDFETGNIVTDLDVQVHGVVKADFSVHTARSLAIGGAIENGSIVAGGNLSVRGGIYGGLHGTVEVGGSLVAAIADNADLRVEGDISISHELVNSRVLSRGLLRIEVGAVAGGSVHARNGVRAGTLGAAAGTPTRISIGPTVLELARIAELEREIRDVQKQSLEVRARLRSLISNMRHIAPAQRECASELLRMAGELKEASGVLRARRADLLRSAMADADGPAEIHVYRRLYPGVCIAIGARESGIRHMYDGPLSIREQEYNGRTSMVLINERTNSLTILPTQAVSQPAPACSS